MVPLTGLAALKQFCASAHFSGLIYIQVSWNHRDKQGNFTVNPPTDWEKGENGELINYIYSGIVTANKFIISRASPSGKDSQGNTIWKPTGKQLNGFEYLKAQAEDGATIYFYPNQPSGGISNAHVGSSHLLFYEIDNLPLFEQWKRLNDLKTLTGLKPCAIVFSGGKSLHVYFRLSQQIDAETHWRRLNRKLTVIQQSDPAICNPARAMRLPGMVRRFAINGQLTDSIDVSLVQSGAKVTIEQVALLIGKSKSCVSEKVKELTPDGFKSLVKSLVLLYKALKAKLNFSELDENTQYIAESLRSVGVELSQGQVSVEEAAANIEILVEAFGYSKVFAALTTVPRWILRDYFKAFLLSAVDTFSEKLEPIPIPIAT